MKRLTSLHCDQKLKNTKDLKLPDFSENLESIFSSGKLMQVDGTNVIRVPFGVRQSVKKRPQRPERWATLVIPFQPLGSPTPPPQAA
tara:strand:+ start:148 stop:408 length:261 start_codon:yes stop_codon:yes gene_type:complete